MAVAIKEQQQATGSRKHVSARGPFEIFTNTKINPPGPRRPVDVAKAAAYFEHSDLSAKHGEEPVRQKIAEMVESIQGGSAVTVLFSQKSPGGMTLVHAWFGANFPLFAHSHPRYGDCLYYVVAGEVILGRQRLGPGRGVLRAQRSSLQVHGGARRGRNPRVPRRRRRSGRPGDAAGRAFPRRHPDPHRPGQGTQRLLAGAREHRRYGLPPGRTAGSLRPDQRRPRQSKRRLTYRIM